MDEVEEIWLEIVRETDGAYLVGDGDQEVWLPKSQVAIIDKKEGFSFFSIPQWLAEEKELV